MKQRLQRIMPRYALIAVALHFIVQVGIYEGTVLLNRNRAFHDFTVPAIDGKIPFCREFIYIYVLSFAFWLFGYIMIARDSRELCYRIVGADLIAQVFVLAFYLFLPSGIEQGVNAWPSGTFPLNTVTDRLTQFIFDADAPRNLFPSTHCMESWLVFRGALQCKRVGKWFPIFCFVFAFGIFASTVLVKQHVFVDIPAGILLAEVGLLLYRVFTRKRKEM